MAFTFLHAADLHLGSPLVGLASRDAGIADRFAAASREALHDLVDRALDEKVAFVVIAGDIYDGAWKDTSIGLFFGREVARLTRAGIPVHLVAGNHDAESVVSQSLALPEGVHRFPSRRAGTVRLEAHRVALHGLSFARPAMDDNPVAAFPPPVAGWFNIGVLHTSLEGAAEHIRYAPCSIADLVGTGYDYWALGHVHDFAVRHERPHIVYPGNLQGRSVRECGPKGAVFVDVADGRVVALRPVHVDRARFAQVGVDAGGLETEAALLAALRQAIAAELAGAPERLTAVRVTISGATALAGALAGQREHWRDQAEALLQQAHVDAWLEALRLETVPPAAAAGFGLDAAEMAGLLDDLAADPALRAAAADMLATIRPPAGVALDGDIDRWLATARAVVLARIAAGAADAPR